MYFLVHSTEINQIGTVYFGELLKHLKQIEHNWKEFYIFFSFYNQITIITIGLHLME